MGLVLLISCRVCLYHFSSLIFRCFYLLAYISLYLPLFLFHYHPTLNVSVCVSLPNSLYHWIFSLYMFLFLCLFLNLYPVSPSIYLTYNSYYLFALPISSFPCIPLCSLFRIPVFTSLSKALFLPHTALYFSSSLSCTLSISHYILASFLLFLIFHFNLLFLYCTVLLYVSLSLSLFNSSIQLYLHFSR